MSKVWLITGGARGLALALVEAALQDGGKEARELIDFTWNWLADPTLLRNVGKTAVTATIAARHLPVRRG